jgi:beta-lactam-binding protein with PASTA domain
VAYSNVWTADFSGNQTTTPVRQFRLRLQFEELTPGNINWRYQINPLSNNNATPFGTFNWSVTIRGVTRSGSVFLDWRSLGSQTTVTLDSASFTTTNQTVSTSGSVTSNSTMANASGSGSWTTSVPAGFTLSYNSNGGSPTPASQTLAAGASFTAAAAPSRSGFSFNFWSGSNGQTYFAGSSYIMPSSNLTLTASWSSIPTTYTVPNVIGDPNTTAVTKLLNAGAGSVNQSFTTSGATSANNRRVLSQTPASGTTATVGNTASITSYNYLLQVPSILGLTESAANTALTNTEFLFRTSTLTTTGATVANNLTVSTQTPTGGTQANPLDNVAYTLFNFLTTVPNVLGQQRDTAVTNLNNLGFTSITIIPDETGATPENNKTVKSQTPVSSATTFNPANTSITLTIFDTGIAGRRNTGTGFTELSNAKRFTGSVWSDLTVQKRFDGSMWRDITN